MFRQKEIYTIVTTMYLAGGVIMQFCQFIAVSVNVFVALEKSQTALQIQFGAKEM
jgi:hypothetical protein